VASDKGGKPYDPFEPDYLRDLVDRLFTDIVKRYFRAKLIGHEKIQRDKGALLIANHSGNAFPYDGIVLDAMLWHKDDLDPKRKFHSVFEKELAVTWWMRLFGIDNFWRRCGGIDLTFENFDILLGRDERVIYYPEGVPGIGKGFNHRYELQKFSTSFVIHSARHRVPVYPVYIINAEWVIPFNYTFRWIDSFVQKHFKIPFLPLPAAPLGFLFPWAWYLALPVRMVFVIGDPIDVRAKTDEAGIQAFDRDDRPKLQAVSESIRQDMQMELDKLVKTYGKRPYACRSFLRKLGANPFSWWRILPIGWPIAFIRHERDRIRKPARFFLTRWLRDWDLIGFYLPFGWFLLNLTRRLRKPPYGYRGLSERERRSRQGEFHWHLKDRPLPPKNAN